ncbi:tetratricopeptide repeat protein [Ursidibacter sp. B-7004-1]
MKKWLLYSLMLSLTVTACSKTRSPEQEQARSTMLQGVTYYEKQQFTTALPLFEQATLQGDSKAPRYLGLSYLNGNGVQKDLQKATRFFQLSANRGDITSKYWLGYLYENGFGVAKDLSIAYHWYQQASVRGDHVSAPAMTALARFYEQGIFVKQDLKQAVNLYQKSAKTGDKQAIEALERLNVR